MLARLPRSLALSSALVFLVSCSPSVVSLLGGGDASRPPNAVTPLAPALYRALGPIGEFPIHREQPVRACGRRTPSPGCGSSSRSDFMRAVALLLVMAGSLEYAELRCARRQPLRSRSAACVERASRRCLRPACLKHSRPTSQ